MTIISLPPLSQPETCSIIEIAGKIVAPKRCPNVFTKTEKRRLKAKSSNCKAKSIFLSWAEAQAWSKEKMRKRSLSAEGEGKGDHGA